jgi:signal peptidase
MDASKLAGNIVTGFFIALFLIAAIIALAPFAGWHFDAVLSGSMEPTVPTGGMVILGPVSAGDIQVGDIIAYDNGRVEVCHRVISIQDGTPARFVTRGDANRSPDGTPVTPEMVTGKLVVAIPLAGYLISFVKTPLGLFLTILLPLLALIGIELKAQVFDKKDEDSPGGPR